MMARIVSLIACIALVYTAVADTQVCILRGLGGAPDQEDRFRSWTRRLTQALVDECGIPAAQIRVCPPDNEVDATSPLTRERAAAAVGDAVAAAGPEDTLLLILVGHGSMQQDAKFVVSGPDITAADLGTWIESAQAAKTVLVNGASASAPFINALSGPNRIICTSTRDASEQNAPEFIEHFVGVLEEGRGDVNRDGEVSLAELCNAASASTQAWYTQEGLVATEHALLDDNGDGRGARLPLESTDGSTTDGELAATVIMAPNRARAAADPAMVARYDAAIAAVEALKAEKGSLPEAEYWDRLETLLLEAARLNQEIHAGSEIAAGAEQNPLPASPESGAPSAPEAPVQPAESTAPTTNDAS